MSSLLDLNGLDIVGQPDEADLRSLAEVRAFAASDRYVKPTEETTETAQRLKEENTAAVRAFRWEMQDELKNEAERIGRILSERDFFAMISRIIPARYNAWTSHGLRGLSVLVNGQWKYVCAVQAGFMPEYSVMRFDEHDLPIAEKYRGWRTVLLRLIMQGFITEAAAHCVFGEPPMGDVSRRYRNHLWNYRNGKGQGNG